MGAWQPLPIGARFHRLVVLDDLGSPDRRRRVLVQCDCGIEKDVDWPALKYGRIKSCGCLLPDMLDARNRTHGKAHTRTYAIWSGMLQRTTTINPTRANGMGYGHVTVCDRWRSFENFLADMGEAPDGMSLDRRDSTRGYEPDNCRWATAVEQRRNQRDVVRWITFNGETLPVAAWAKRLNLPASTLYTRLNAGWPLERALIARAGGL